MQLPLNKSQFLKLPFISDSLISKNLRNLKFIKFLNLENTILTFNYCVPVTESLVTFLTLNVASKNMITVMCVLTFLIIISFITAKNSSLSVFLQNICLKIASYFVKSTGLFTYGIESTILISIIKTMLTPQLIVSKFTIIVTPLMTFLLTF